jgi:hypothetical protein
MRSAKTIEMDEAEDRGQVQIAAAELTAALRELADESGCYDEAKETIAAYELLSTIRLEGDSDVLVARKVRQLADLIRRRGEIGEIISTAQAVNVEVREAFGQA